MYGWEVLGKMAGISPAQSILVKRILFLEYYSQISTSSHSPKQQCNSYEQTSVRRVMSSSLSLPAAGGGPP